LTYGLTYGYANRNLYDWRVGWCGFGTVFPTGDMRLQTKSIDEDEFPCGGVRMVQGSSRDSSKVVSNKAAMCCGIEDDEWKTIGGGQIAKYIDTGHCKFKSTPAYLTSMKGTSSHWHLNGITAPVDPSEKGFTIHLVPLDGSTDAGKAASYNYQLQWCGFGDRNT